MAILLVFAPDALVRFRGGHVLIHTSNPGMPAFETDNPALIAWVCQFARPADPDQLRMALPASDRTVAGQVLDYLRRSGVLVATDQSDEGTPNAAERSGRTQEKLRALARSTYELACDLLGMGPAAEQELVRASGIGVEQRLLGMLAATDGLRKELQSMRASAVAMQLQGLQIDARARGLKLHIGCGQGHLPGWINIDVHPAPLALNVLRGLPFSDASAEFVFVSHLLEHLYFPRDVQPFLAELRRVLAPGGIVRIVVPDIGKCIEAYVRNDRDFFASRRETWPWWPSNPTRLEDFLAYAGAGPEPAFLFESHKYGYDFETLQRVLNDAGFVSVIESGYMASEHMALRVDEISAVARATYGQRHYSLFVEASGIAWAGSGAPNS
ncbi:MAG: methyltransferase domain-containing protein [Gammaproteobacteria bacterium]|nr:methyltransferase domain-containing protein [Gammaproteobacteria bacterium]